MSGSNALQITDPNAGNALAQAPSWADAAQSVAGTVGSGVDALGQWLAAQRAKSSQMGLWNDQTGLPTGGGIVNAGQQFGNALLMGTTGPEAAATDATRFAAQARQINGGTMNEAAQRGQKPADGTLLHFLDGDKGVYQNAAGSDARLHRGDELSQFPSMQVENKDGSSSSVWFKHGQGDQATQVAQALRMPAGNERDRALGLALGYAPVDVERYIAASQQPPIAQ